MHILAALAFILTALIFLIMGLASVLRDLLERDFADGAVKDIDGARELCGVDPPATAAPPDECCTD
jgi:hypothetical protein